MWFNYKELWWGFFSFLVESPSFIFAPFLPPGIFMLYWTGAVSQRLDTMQKKRLNFSSNTSYLYRQQIFVGGSKFENM